MTDETVEMTDELNNELTKAYLGGLLDGTGSLTVNVTKRQEYAFDYHMEPEVMVNRKRPHSIQILDDWTADNGIFGSASKKNDRFQFRMNRAADMARLLEILRPYIVDRAAEVDILVDDILPRLQEGYHLESRSNFVEVVGMVDELNEASIHGGDRKYTADFFRDEWADELD